MLERNSYSQFRLKINYRIHPGDLFLFTSSIFSIIILLCGYCLMAVAYSPKNDREQFWAEQPVNICQCLMLSSCQANSCWLLAQHGQQGTQTLDLALTLRSHFLWGFTGPSSCFSTIKHGFIILVGKGIYFWHSGIHVTMCEWIRLQV